MTGSIIHWTTAVCEDWKIPLAATPQGLCYAGANGEPLEAMTGWLHRRFPESAIVRSEEAMAPYVRELIEYFARTRKAFTVPLDLRGTPFQLSVWHAIQEIPHGQTVSYSEVARRIRKPNAVRAVGGALGANPVVIVVPCHRVVGKHGSLTGYNGGIDMKARLLELELGLGHTVSQ